METRPERLFLTVLPQNVLVPSQQSLAFFLQENPPLLLKDLLVLWQVLCCVAGMGMVEDGVWVLVSSHLLPVVETGAGDVQWDAGSSRYDPKCGQREGAEVLPTSGNASRIRSSGGADVLASRAAGHSCSSGDAGTRRHDVLGTAVARAAGCPAGLGRRPKRSQARGQRAEAGSLDSFDDVFLSCRTQSPSSWVARVTSTLHNLCAVHSSSIPAHNSHARMSHARCVVNSVGDTEESR